MRRCGAYSVADARVCALAFCQTEAELAESYKKQGNECFGRGAWEDAEARACCIAQQSVPSLTPRPPLATPSAGALQQRARGGAARGARASGVLLKPRRSAAVHGASHRARSVARSVFGVRSRALLSAPRAGPLCGGGGGLHGGAAGGRGLRKGAARHRQSAREHTHADAPPCPSTGARAPRAGVREAGGAGAARESLHRRVTGACESAHLHVWTHAHDPPFASFVQTTRACLSWSRATRLQRRG
jgi:hypothetical protein